MEEDDLEVIPKNYRCFTFILYDESIHYNFKDVLFNLMTYKRWAYIKHDPDEEEKIPHYHFILYLDNPTTINSISKKTGIPIHKIKVVRNIRGMCRYLTHIDFPDKIQYDISDVKVSNLWRRKYLKFFEDIKTEEEIIQDIYNFIDNFHCDSYVKKLKDLIIFVNFNCYDTVYKRYRYEILDYLRMNL